MGILFLFIGCFESCSAVVNHMSYGGVINDAEIADLLRTPGLDPSLREMYESTNTWERPLFGVTLCVALITIVSAVGLLLRKNWARLLFIGLMVVQSLCAVVVGLTVRSLVRMFTSGALVGLAGDSGPLVRGLQLAAWVGAAGVILFSSLMIAKMLSSAVRAEFAPTKGS